MHLKHVRVPTSKLRPSFCLMPHSAHVWQTMQRKLRPCPCACAQTLSSNPMDGIKYQLKAAEAVLLLAPGALFVTAALIGMWLERAMLVAALARNIVWFMRSTMWLCTMPCRGRAGRRTAWAGDQNELNMPLLNPTGDGDAHASVTARESGGNRINSKLITNDRGIRLAFTSHV